MQEKKEQKNNAPKFFRRAPENDDRLTWHSAKKKKMLHALHWPTAPLATSRTREPPTLSNLDCLATMGVEYGLGLTGKVKLTRQCPRVWFRVETSIQCRTSFTLGPNARKLSSPNTLSDTGRLKRVYETW
ncbi:hypothetical protein BaRGS_00006942, partial [Batillaria attramentaria]